MKKIAILLLIILQSHLASAVVLQHPAQVQLTVPDRSLSSLSFGIKNAFSQVLIKLSGNPHVMTLPAIQNAMPDMQQWVKSYGYEEGQAALGESDLILDVHFDLEGIKSLLRDAGQPIWVTDRPLTLVVLQGGGNEEQLNFARLAKQRGLSVIFPEMDLSDQGIIDSKDQEQEKLKSWSDRYGVTSVFSVNFNNSDDGKPSAAGQYWLKGVAHPWRVESDSQNDVTVDSVNQLLSMMASELVITNNAALKSNITMQVTGINDVADYANVIHYLRSVDGVNSVSVKDMGPSNLLLNLRITGDITSLKKFLATGGRLQPVSDALVDNSDHADLNYFW